MVLVKRNALVDAIYKAIEKYVGIIMIRIMTFDDCSWELMI